MSEHRHGHRRHGDDPAKQSTGGSRHHRHRPSRRQGFGWQRKNKAGCLEGLIFLLIVVLFLFAYKMNWFGDIRYIRSKDETESVETPGQLPDAMPPLHTGTGR